MATKKETAELLVWKLSFGCAEAKQKALLEIRHISKRDADNRVSLVQAGALSPLVELLSSLDPRVQENAVTALFNLSIHNDNRVAITNVSGGLEAIAQVIREGLSADAKANAAALLYSIVVKESLRPVVGSCTPLLSALLELLRIGSSKCKADCLKALFYIAISPSNKSKLVAAGAVPLLLALSGYEKEKLTEGCLAVLAQLALCPEGSAALLWSDTAIPHVISLLNKGSPVAQENAASTLLNVCVNGKQDAIRELLDDITCIPALRKLYTSESVRGKIKAEALMKILDIPTPPAISSESSDTVSVDSVDEMARIKEPEAKPQSKAPDFWKSGKSNLPFKKQTNLLSICGFPLYKSAHDNLTRDMRLLPLGIRSPSHVFAFRFII